jgi:hypothetical protein
MAINQNLDLGVINRLRGSVTLPSNSQLNINASGISEDGIIVEPESGGGDLLAQMSGAVVSLRPYTLVKVRFGVVRTLTIGTTWYNQWKTNSAVGDVQVTPVTAVAPTHYILNAVISSVGRIAENGESADLPIVLTGMLALNSDLWSAA